MCLRICDVSYRLFECCHVDGYDTCACRAYFGVVVVFGALCFFFFLFSFLFFFQAEDGIRDLVRSRGLGDVYKRQVYDCHYYLRLRQAKQFCAEVEFEGVARCERDFRAVVEIADEWVVGCGVVVQNDVLELSLIHI